MTSAYRPLLVIAEGNRRFRTVGELDLATRKHLVNALEPELAHPGDIVLDLSGITFIDASGFHTLIEAGEELRGKGRLLLAGPPPRVRRFFALIDELTGVLERANVMPIPASESFPWDAYGSEERPSGDPGSGG